MTAGPTVMPTRRPLDPVGPKRMVLGGVVGAKRIAIVIAAAVTATALSLPGAASDVSNIARASTGTRCGPDGPWFNTRQAINRRVSELLSCMTLADKVRELYGVAPPTSSSPVGYVQGDAHLGIPPLILSDGPAGLTDYHPDTEPRPATALPAPVSLAASFDPGLAQSYGKLLGTEARARGVDVLYGPAINTVRVPQGGRNFEYLGEDPNLASQLVVSEVKGIQAERVAAQVKHFALNDQENDRKTTSSDADPRTMREIYLAPFQAAVQVGGAWSVMCANNEVNGTYACQNDQLLRAILDKGWGFNGVVGSDYAATHDAVASIRAGLDQSFTLADWGEYYSQLATLVTDGKVPVKLVNDATTRVLRLMFRVGLFDHLPSPPPVNVQADGAFARAAAEEGTVLLKNSGDALPLNPTNIKSIAVIGPYAAQAYTGGGGSSHVLPYYTVSPVAGLEARFGSGIQVTTADGSSIPAAVALAKSASVAIVIVGDQEQEGRDRPNIDLPGNQDSLIASVAAANPRTIVVLNTGAPVTMPWLDSVPAVVEAWYPGEEDGNALAAVLAGDVDPSGKLPETFPVDLAQDPAHSPPRYPAQDGVYEYSEGLDVGYRWYDAKNLTPLFPFGFGLSYTTFAFEGLQLTTLAGGSVQVTATIQNTGGVAGADVVQVYVGDPPSAGEPPHQLKAFLRVSLASGSSQQVTFTLPAAAFSVWDDTTSQWVVPGGTYDILVGDSSRQLPLTGTVGVSPMTLSDGRS